MLKVLNCIVVDHDLTMVAVAALFCLTASLTAFRLYARTGQGRRRLAWSALTGLAAGTGVWATHFIAMLAYEPQIPVTYGPFGTAVSMLVAVVATGVAFYVARPDSLRRQLAAGTLFALGVATMHFCGMAAFQPQGWLAWDRGLLALSVILDLAFALAAFVVCKPSQSVRVVAAALLLTLSICSLHFIAMSAVLIMPDPAMAAPAASIARDQLALGVGALAAVLLIGAVNLLVVDVQNQRLGAAQLALLFEANPAPMWLLQLNTLQFLQVNQAAVDAYGYSRGELLNMTAYQIVHPDEQEDLKARAGKATYDGERVWRHRTASGGEILVRPYARPIRHGGDEVMLVTLFDVTESARAAEELREAKDAAEAANRAKGEFLANMSHEIRTPLNGVLGVVGALERTPLSAEQMEMVSIIESSASTLQRLLSDVLDSSRVDSGEVSIEARPFDLRAALLDTAYLFAPRAQEKGVAFEVDLVNAPEGWVRGDPDRLRQIIGNLLSNAVKFTQVGVVKLIVERAPDNRILFTVVDTGLGFDETFHQRLFGRFEQADATVTRRFGGSGLGLAIGRDLALRMGGDLRASSVVGEGSTFVLELPLPACQAPAGKIVVTEAHVDRPMRVLLADDHPVNRRVVELILGSLPVQLTSVGDGVEAVEAVEARAYDLILMDLQMPRMDGLEAIRRIRTLEALQRRASTPIYVLSANVHDEHQAASEAAGANGHLAKPIMADSLIALVAREAAARLAA